MSGLNDYPEESQNAGPLDPGDFAEPTPEMLKALDGHITTLFDKGITRRMRSAFTDVVEPVGIPPYSLYFMAHHTVVSQPGKSVERTRTFGVYECNDPLALAIVGRDKNALEYRISDALRVRTLVEADIPGMSPVHEEYIKWLMEPLEDVTGLSADHAEPLISNTGVPIAIDLVFRGTWAQVEHAGSLVATSRALVEENSKHTKVVRAFRSFDRGRYVTCDSEGYEHDDPSNPDWQHTRLAYRDAAVQFAWTAISQNGITTAKAPVLREPPPLPPMPQNPNDRSETNLLFVSPEWQNLTGIPRRAPTLNALTTINQKLAEFLDIS